MAKPRSSNYIIFFVILFYCNKKNIAIGDSAPEFTTINWLQSTPLKISALKSKVVLIRWWTDQCLFCEQSKEALNEWHQKYADRGLVIIGMYHPKPIPKKMDAEEVQEMILEKGFQFPIAIDDEWKILNKYKPNRSFDDFTSASYVIDKKGKVRFYHKGGEYHSDWAPGHESCIKMYHHMDSCIRYLLLEN